MDLAGRCSSRASFVPGPSPSRRTCRSVALGLVLASSAVACARPAALTGGGASPQQTLAGARPESVEEAAAASGPALTNPLARSKQLWQRAQALRAQGRVMAVQLDVLQEAGGESARRRREVLEDEAERWREAEITVYQQIADDAELAEAPERPEALFALAHALQDVGDAEGAKGRYRQLVEEYPTAKRTPDAYLALANLAFAEGELEEAAQRCDGALVRGHGWLRKRALYLKAWSLRGLGPGSYRPAMEALREIVRIGRGAPGSLEAALDQAAELELVAMYAAHGDPDEADAFFAKIGSAAAPLLAAVKAKSTGTGTGRRLERLERQTY